MLGVRQTLVGRLVQPVDELAHAGLVAARLEGGDVGDEVRTHVRDDVNASRPESRFTYRGIGRQGARALGRQAWTTASDLDGGSDIGG